MKYLTNILLNLFRSAKVCREATAGIRKDETRSHAVFEMVAGLPESPYRRRLQTALFWP
ncbi:hypothetical protein FUAX_55140 (plasmid) [Fulvitalea axinellae]|uniref:Uncharacterized protein n=1 Tax=Fulvitalea axinellae TaxID=1182444 RepID=A0AAU9D1S7_9BACT|nr:hypothetical protein FUAX_55140 [Fulvitalea axinellae]